MTLIGVLAGILTTGCWLPQLLRSWRTRSTGDISWVYLLALGFGVVLWTVYAAVNADTPLLVTNAATAAALTSLAVMKVGYERRARSVRELSDHAG
jgi:MtN3 and saliva related transmembrane protein